MQKNSCLTESNATGSPQPQAMGLGTREACTMRRALHLTVASPRLADAAASSAMETTGPVDGHLSSTVTKAVDAERLRPGAEPPRQSLVRFVVTRPPPPPVRPQGRNQDKMNLLGPSENGALVPRFVG